MGMKKYLFMGVGIVAGIIILFILAWHQKGISGETGSLSTQIMTQTDSVSMESEVEAVIETEGMHFSKENVSLSDMLFKNHLVFSNTPMTSASFKTLFAYHKEREKDNIIAIATTLPGVG